MVPKLDDLAVPEAEDIHSGKADAFAGRGDPAPGTLMRTLDGPASHHRIALCHYQVDGQVDVRKRRAEQAGYGFLPIRARRRRAWAQIMPDIVVGESVLSDVHVPLVPDFVVETTDDCLV